MLSTPLWSLGTNLVYTADALFIADTFNNAIRKLELTGEPHNRRVSTIAGGGGRGFQDGVGPVAKFFWPRGIAAARDGRTLYVVEEGNHAIRIVFIESSKVETLMQRLPSRAHEWGAPPELAGGICVRPDTGELLVSHAGAGSIAVFDPAYAVRPGTPTRARLLERCKRCIRSPGGLACADLGRGILQVLVTNRADANLGVVRLGPSTASAATPGSTVDPLTGCNNEPLRFVGRPQAIAQHGATLFVTDYDGGAIVRLTNGTCSATAANPHGFRAAILVGEGGASLVENRRPSTGARLSYPRGLAVSSNGQTLYVSDSGQAIKAVDLTPGRRAKVVDLAGADGCGLHDGPAARARFWMARGCPWERATDTDATGGTAARAQLLLGGDGDSAGCGLRDGCRPPTPAGAIRWLVVHATPRSGSSWLCDLLAFSPRVFMHDECAAWPVAGYWLRGQLKSCSFELLRSQQLHKGGWPVLEARMEAFRKVAARAYPRPVAAGFKLIDNNMGFIDNHMQRWKQLARRWNLTEVVLVRTRCFPHYVSFHHPHGTDPQDASERALKARALPRLRADPADIRRFCEERNAEYRQLLSELRELRTSPISGESPDGSLHAGSLRAGSLHVVVYEELKEHPAAVLRPLIAQLLGGAASEDEAERLVARASVTVPLHNRSEYSYVANPEEVRAMRPEQFDFKLPPTT